MKVTYLDNAASTRPALEVLAAMNQAATEFYANPASAHAGGAAAARALDAARAELAEIIGGEAREVTFTSGGTEANALAILGVATHNRRRHLVVGALEHPAVLRNLERLVALDGCELSIAPADASGIVSAAAVLALVRPETALVCLMHVNNELGTIQPVAELARGLQTAATRAGQRKPHLHVDAVQSLGHVALRASTLGADSIAVSAHKIHGPNGVGALWLRAGAKIEALWDGGRQERGVRSGTENVPGAVGLACAARLAAQGLRDGDAERMAALRDRFEFEAAERIPGLRATIPSPERAVLDRATYLERGACRAPHIVSVALPKLPAEPLLHALEARGVWASAGSACASKTRGPSHVLKAVGIDDKTAVLRFSLSRETTDDDIETAVAALKASVDELSSAPRRRA